MNASDWSDRYERAASQRMYLVESASSGDTYHFSVMGTSDKIYKIVICNNQKIKCSCPDCHHSRKFCKHLMLLLIRMLGISESSVRESMFVSSPVVLDACKLYMSKKSQIVQRPESPKPRRPLDDEPGCPICFEPLTELETVIWCETCGKNIHQDCFAKWKNPRCVYCRSEMHATKKRKVAAEWTPS